jgi:hypothetical protein
MKIFALLALLCTSSQVVFAYTTECKLLPKASDRLACYDKATPPSAVAKFSKTVAAPDKLAASKIPEGRRFADMLDAENSKLNAKLKTICRGC